MYLDIERLTKSYGRGAPALEHVSLEVPSGSIVAVLGANGAGKTTLLRCLATVIVPGSGRILVDGEVLTRGRLDLRRRAFFLPDFPMAYGEATPIDHAAMVCRLYGREDSAVEDRVFELLESFDLLGCARTPLGLLSRGQVYKAGLVPLFAVEPELVLLDEPFASGIDPHGIATLKQKLRSLGRSGAIVLYTTQILEIAESFSDRVAILNRGRLHAYGALPELAGGTGGEGLEGIIESLRERRAG